MGERAVPAILINLEIPDYCSEQHDWRLHKEIALLLDPSAVQVHHYGVCRLIGVGNIRHERRVYGVAPVGVFRVVKVDDIERWWLFTVALLVVQHMVVCYKRQVGLLVIVDVKPKALFNLLLDEIVDDGIRLAEPGVPSTIVALNGLTTFIHPL